MRSEYPHPLNLGTDELVTINELVDMVAEISEKRITKRHDLSKPQGVRGRNSDNSRLREVLGGSPRSRLGKASCLPTGGSNRKSRRQDELPSSPETKQESRRA